MVTRVLKAEAEALQTKAVFQGSLLSPNTDNINFAREKKMGLV
jgi:hypothetical protein